LHQPPSESAAAALEHHHRLMSKFLDTHRAVLLACVGAVPAESVPAIDIGQRMAVASAEADEPDDLDGPDDLSATTAPDAEAEPSSTPFGPVTMDAAVRRLVGLVSERTGYPPDMLGLDLDLEADLGVDSIKRVEILSALQNGGTLGGGDVEVDGLSKLKTLRAIAEWIVSVSAAAAADRRAAGTIADEPVSHAPLMASPDLPAEPDPPISRMRLSVVDAGEPSVAAPAATSGVVLLTDDGRGIAEMMRERLAEQGIAGIVLPTGSREDIAHAVDAVRREHDGVAAVVHLAPLAGDLPRDPREFFARLDRELIALFTLARGFESDLRSRSGTVLAATALGGAFGVDTADGGWPGSAAVSGFIKSLAREWPEVCCKTVDFEAASDGDRIVAALTSELGWRDGLIEVGYRAGRRRTLVAVPAPLEAHEPALALDDRSIVLITGGARGITAEIARELAERFRPTLVLAGRSPLPDAPEPAELSTCTDERQLRAALVDRCRRLGDTPVFADIEAACTRILHAREIAASIAAMRAAGAAVEYHAVDVADAGAFDALIGDVYARHHRIDGVIHGAGVIEDKLIAEKTLESFERVLRPKIAGALTLARSLRPESLGFLAFFSSVSARYGNRGQSDYAAANEILNRLAASLNGQWPARVVSIDWGPWQTSSGMVSAELAGRFAEAGVSLITRASGRRAFVDELLFGDSRDAEVIWGGPAKNAGMPCVSAASFRAATLPLLRSRVSLRRPTGGICEAVVQTDPEIDEYLNDHVLDGVPVLPAAIAMELMAETAACHAEGLVVTGVSDLRVLQGITYPRFEGRTLTVAVAARPAGEAADSGVRAAASITSAGDRRILHYQADVTLQRAFEAAPPVEPLRLKGARPLPVTIEEAYRQWLFHGPRFEGIASVIALGDNGIAGRLRSSSPARLLDGESAGDWLIDPLIVDGALQLLILWARAQIDETPLPSRMRRYHRYTDVFPSDVLCEATIARPSSGSTLTCQLRLFDEDRRLLGWIEDMDVTCSRALNRLSEPVAVRAGA
jgi:NAD(P)-dependent dehydrogenase (short-subunit alcohol dehydrogenase family)